jgi:5-methylcytosine-specific restriction endonuclease McrA
LGTIPDYTHCEHILPLAKGGTDDLINLASACGHCNGNKSDKVKAIDPETKNLVSIFHPRNDKWNEHFAWSENFLDIVGKTAKGKATVQLLDMNQQSIRNLREVFRDRGLHPPDILLF